MLGTGLLYTLPGGSSKRCVMSLQDTGASACSVYRTQCLLYTFTAEYNACHRHCTQCLLCALLAVCCDFCIHFFAGYMDCCIHSWGRSVQFSSVAQSCPTLCDPMNRSTPGLPVHHKLLEFTQTHVHRVSDAIQPSHLLSSPSPPASNPSQHQCLFQ